MKYQLIIGRDLKTFNRTVNRHARKGYRQTSDPSIYNTADGLSRCQVNMVLSETPDDAALLEKILAK